MGNEIRGVQKNVPSCSFRNSLRFHEVHGDNVKLSNCGTIASRKDGFCKGLVFTHRPVLECEPVCIKFLNISTNWSGALRIGFTMHDPMSMKSKLPRYVCPDLISTPGNWAKAIAERIAKKDSILYIYFDMNGDVHYGVDSEELGIFMSGVNAPEKLWAVIDIYGNTESIELVDPATLNRECFADAYNNLTKLSRSRINECNETAVINLLSELNTKLLFHPFHGSDVQLKMSNTIIGRKGNVVNCAYAFTERHLELGEKIGLQAVQVSSSSQGHFYYGITSCDPNTLTKFDLPPNPEDLLDRSEYWVVQKDENIYKVNDIIMFSLSSEGEVTVIKNGIEPCSSFHVDLSLPLWLFFNFGGCICEARLLGSSVSDIGTNILRQLRSLRVCDSPPDSNIKECVICYEKPVNSAVYRCGHMCMCYDCALKMCRSESDATCPICRDPIRDVIKIYN